MYLQIQSSESTEDAQILYSRAVQPFFSEGHTQIHVIDGGPFISGVASAAFLRRAKVGVVRGTKGRGPWRATMELTRGRGPFPIVMARVEVPSAMKQERDGRQGALPPGKFF